MILSVILLPMIMALIGYLLFRKDNNKYYYLSLITSFITLILMIILTFMNDTSISINYICELGINLQTDGFRKVYGLVICFMWFMTLMMSDDYFKHHNHMSRYYFFTLMTLGSLLGVFMASDMFTAFIFFEIMSFTSFTWVIEEETKEAIKAANTYLAVAVIGGMVALMGLFILYNKLGTLNLNELYYLASNFEDKTILYVAGGCILFGFGAKAGMFPLHIWLPKAHPAAPAPASALLSGVLTKSGIWGIIAISVNIFRYDVNWALVILILGTITMFLGALLALFSINLKRTLACSSMSQIGFILVAISMIIYLGDEGILASSGALLHMMNHSLFKLVLFMCAGIIYMNAHTLNLNELQGFGKNKPVLKICFLIAALGIAGIPLLNGYVSKTLIHEAIVEASINYSYLKIVEWIFLISGGLTLAYMSKLYICIFIKDNDKYKEKTKYMSIKSYIALIGSTILLPILGLHSNSLMIRISNSTMSFFNSEEIINNINFFSLENLKGGFISILIGVLVYIFIVHKFMIKDNKYVDLWPSKLDLEDLIYRPLILNILPNSIGYISKLFGENIITKKIYYFVLRIYHLIAHLLMDSSDLIVLGLKKTLFKEERKEITDFAYSSPSYFMGSIIDNIKKDEDHKYAKRSYQVSSSFKHYTHELTDSMSFPLLCMIIMIVLVLIYILK